MRGLDLLLLTCCLCSLSTLGGKAQADTTCPCNRVVVMLYYLHGYYTNVTYVVCHMRPHIN